MIHGPKIIWKEGSFDPLVHMSDRTKEGLKERPPREENGVKTLNKPRYYISNIILV